MVKINGVDIKTMGVELSKGAYAALLAPAPLKGFVENDDPTKNGIEILTHKANGESLARVAEREVTLTFIITGDNSSDFLAKYQAFINVLNNGKITLYVEDLERTFTLVYANSTQYDNYRLKACKLAVKFREPNPAER